MLHFLNLQQKLARPTVWSEGTSTLRLLLSGWRPARHQNLPPASGSLHIFRPSHLLRPSSLESPACFWSFQHMATCLPSGFLSSLSGQKAGQGRGCNPPGLLLLPQKGCGLPSLLLFPQHVHLACDSHWMNTCWKSNGLSECDLPHLFSDHSLQDTLAIVQQLFFLPQASSLLSPCFPVDSVVHGAGMGTLSETDMLNLVLKMTLLKACMRTNVLRTNDQT